ncbi:MAG TPA: hypothetical protein VFC44_09560 [Candidatus Saccharimonadales bacterium]|nr:hypothetical protein [Candidatus Saccharimonadales bacterium]
MKSKLIARTLQGAFWAGILLGSAMLASADTVVTFQVDMSAQITAGTFVPGTDTVSAHGTFNGWGAGISLTNNPVAANPHLYTGITDDTSETNGAVMIFKYVLDGSAYETTTDGDNRCAQLPASGGSLVLPASYYADAGPASTANVTFQVDMAEQIQLGNFNTNSGMSVEVNGTFNSWGSGNTLTNDPTIRTTNTTGTITSNVYVGTFPITGPTNATQEFKYVMEPAGSYEGPSPADSDYDNGQNRFFIITSQKLPIVSFSDVPLNVTITNNVTFEVDMTTQIEAGNFTSNNTVEIHGDFNSWGGGQTMTNNPAASNPDIYSTVIPYVAAANTVVNFKYVIQPGTQWENTASGNNRTATLLSTNGNFASGPVYFSDQSPSTLIDFVTSTNCMVKFTVNMTNAVGTDGTVFDNAYPSGDQIFINGLNAGVNNSFWTWASPPFGGGPAAYLMTQISNTTLFTVTLPVNEGQGADLIYKYSINGFDNEAGFADNHQRWIRSLPAYTMPTDTFASQGTSTQAEIPAGNLAIARSTGGQVKLSWLGRRGVHLQTATNLNPATVWTDQNSTDGTNLIVSAGGTASTNYTPGPSNLFYRLVGPK